jgi:hypothetical protein
VKPDISEFSYGYAITEELIRGVLPPITAAPVFPSLIEEGQAGFDVKLSPGGIPLFLQFKVCDCMVRDTAREVRTSRLTTPFYRMHLRPARHSAQHQLLLNLETAGYAVYYVAPSFHLPLDLNNHYVSGLVAQNSIFVPPSVIGRLPDAENHYLAFRPNGPYWFFSEPKRINVPLNANVFCMQVLERIASEATTTDSAVMWASLSRKMIHIIETSGHERELGLEMPHFGANVPPTRIVAYLTRSYFGSELLVARRGEKK